MSSSPHPLLPPLPPRISSKSYLIHSQAEPRLFHPHPSLGIASRVTLESAGVGLLVSAVQNALEKHDRGAMGIFTRTGGTIAFFSAMGFSYSFMKAVTANVRETDDSLNGAAGGCAAGFIAGIRAGSLPMAVGACAFLGTVIYTFNEAGSSLTGRDMVPLTREEREARRLEFFKKPKSNTEAAAPA